MIQWRNYRQPAAVLPQFVKFEDWRIQDFHLKVISWKQKLSKVIIFDVKFVQKNSRSIKEMKPETERHNLEILN